MVQDVREGDANAFRVEVDVDGVSRLLRARAAQGAGRSQPPSSRADLSVNAVRRLGIAEGRSLLVRLPPERLRVYPRA